MRNHNEHVTSEVIPVSAEQLEALQMELELANAVIDQYHALTRIVLKEERQYAMEHGAAEMAERLDPHRLNGRIAQVLSPN
jgi:hypothetical protein